MIEIRQNHQIASNPNSKKLRNKIKAPRKTRTAEAFATRQSKVEPRAEAQTEAQTEAQIEPQTEAIAEAKTRARPRRTRVPVGECLQKG
jgi:hypothetical protein